MKRKILFLLAVIAISSSALALKKDPAYRSARKTGATTKFSLCVTDDSGCAVSNASVRVRMGMNFGPKGYWIEGATDGNGQFTVSGKTCGDEILIFVTKDGYYSSQKKLCYIRMGHEREVSNGKWLPYDECEKIILRRKKAPVSLRTFGFGSNRFMPTTNVWIGVDMQVGDFIKPYGKGEVPDFEILAEWDGKPPVDCRHCEARIRFCGDFSGGYFEKQVKESEYPYVYGPRQNADFHVKEWSVSGRDANGYVQHQLDDRVLVTRTRCVVDSSGLLKSAHYGYIRVFAIDADWNHLPSICLAGVFNPTPNDTNLEPKK